MHTFVIELTDKRQACCHGYIAFACHNYVILAMYLNMKSILSLVIHVALTASTSSASMQRENDEVFTDKVRTFEVS